MGKHVSHRCFQMTIVIFGIAHFTHRAQISFEQLKKENRIHQQQTTQIFSVDFVDVDVDVYGTILRVC